MHRLTKLHEERSMAGQKSVKNSAKTQQPERTPQANQTDSLEAQSHSNHNYNNTHTMIRTPGSINAKKKEFSRTSPKRSQQTQKISPNVSTTLTDPQLELFDCVLNVLLNEEKALELCRRELACGSGFHPLCIFNYIDKGQKGWFTVDDFEYF